MLQLGRVDLLIRILKKGFELLIKRKLTFHREYLAR